MISIDFAPNESWDDALLSLKLLFQPWRWKEGKQLYEVKTKILKELNLSRFRSYILLFLTGRAALYNLLKSFNLKPGDEIIVQAFTCEAVVLPIIALKLKPIFVDIETQSFSMDPIDLQKKLSARAKVLILQHTFSITPIHRKTILSFVRQHNLVLIEDIAHGFGNSKFEIRNSKHYILLSFGRSKAISSVFGGAIIGWNKKVMEKLEKSSLAQPSYSFIFKCLLYKPIVMIVKSTYNIFLGKIIHKIANNLGLIIPEITTTEKKGIYEPTFNKAYPNVLATLLLHQLKKIDRMKKNRSQITNFYLKKIFHLPPNIKYQSRLSRKAGQISNIALLRYPILVNNRDLILKNAAKSNIFLGKWYDQVVAPKGFDLERVGYRKGSCPTAEKICQQIINLPTNISLKDAQRLVRRLNDVL